ncbi:hypothetical protein DVH05_010902 [Phytophthora capsici]|nr:hypothetical protein DVH05_010902 [Phytophthora capsici]
MVTSSLSLTQDESPDNYALRDGGSLDIPLAQLTPSPSTPSTQPVTSTTGFVDFAMPASSAPATAQDVAPASNSVPARTDRRTRRRRATVRATRGSGFTRVEVDSLLDLLENINPIGRDEWETVARRHNENHPGLDRTVESLRRKFAKLYRTNMGTRNPHIPDDVARDRGSIRRIRGVYCFEEAFEIPKCLVI